MTKKEEFYLKYHGEKVAVHCDTEEKAKAYFALEDSFGTIWANGEKLERTRWEFYNKETCYARFKDGTVGIGYLQWFKDEGYKIVEFELDEPNGYAIEDTPSPMEETFKVGDVVTYTLLGATAKIVDIKPCYLLEGYNYYVTEDKIKKVKPLKKITKEQLADMGYEVGE